MVIIIIITECLRSGEVYVSIIREDLTTGVCNTGTATTFMRYKSKARRHAGHSRGFPPSKEYVHTTAYKDIGWSGKM